MGAMPRAKTPLEIWGAQWMETEVKTTAEHLAQAINKVLRRFFLFFLKELSRQRHLSACLTRQCLDTGWLMFL